MRIVERRNGLVGLLVGLALFCVALPASAQDARLKLDHLEKLSAKAVEVNNVTLDGDMLQLAAKLLDLDKHDPKAGQAKKISKNLNGIYVKKFKLSQRNEYACAYVEEVRIHD